MRLFTKNLVIYFHNLHRPYKPWVIMHIMMKCLGNHFTDVIMSAMASQITSVYTVCSTVGPGADQRKHQSSASLTFAWGIHRWPVSSPHKKANNAENVSIGWRHRDFLHMAFWIESFDLPNPLHWRHIGAMASRATGNSTNCSAAPSCKQVRRQLVHITGAWGGESTSH